MGRKSLIVIGAGIGGLSAACYARLSGVDVHLYEMHHLPGGLCTSWSRSGYTFDGSIHHLAGCHPESPIYAMWEELGAMPREVRFPPILTKIEEPDGRGLTVYTDLSRLEEHLLEQCPSDARWIRRYVDALQRMIPHDFLELPITGYAGLLQHAFVLPTVVRWGRVSMREVGAQRQDPLLRGAFPSFQYDWPDIPALLHINLLSQCAGRNYGFPTGGSLPFAQSIARRVLDLGGQITYGTRVERVLVESGQAVGVELADGMEHRADAVISNAFEWMTLYELLGGKYVDNVTRVRLADPQDTITMGTHVSFGVDRDLSDEPHSLVLRLEIPVTLADQTVDRLSVELFGNDEAFAPPGKGVIKVLLNASYRYWRDLREDERRYREVKEDLADRIAGLLEDRFPGLVEQIEVRDVATPMTTERYTGNGRAYGEGQGFDPSLLFSRPRSNQELRRFYWIGQSAGGAGIPGCAAMGRLAVRSLCRELGVRFGGRRI